MARRRKGWRAGVVAVGMGAALVLLAALPPGEADSRVRQGEVTIVGTIEDLFPGQRTTIDLLVTNPEAFDILATEVDVTVDDAGDGCDGSWLVFDELPEPVLVPASSTGPVPVPVELDFETPEECRSAEWSLGFVAQLVEADAGSATTTTTAATDTTATTATTTATSLTAPPAAEQPGRPGGGLALTGADIAPLVALGAALIAAGAVIRRRT